MFAEAILISLCFFAPIGLIALVFFLGYRNTNGLLLHPELGFSASCSELNNTLCLEINGKIYHSTRQQLVCEQVVDLMLDKDFYYEKKYRERVNLFLDEYIDLYEYIKLRDSNYLVKQSIEGKERTFKIEAMHILTECVCDEDWIIIWSSGNKNLN